MGLIKAAKGAVSSAFADQWKEFFYCDSLDTNVLMVKGQKRITARSSNTQGSDNIISNGSGIAVADGQCMVIVDQGAVVEFCAEPGEFTYNSSTEPSLFTGSLGDSILETFKLIGRRFTYGGDTARDQRVYYFNTKELVDNKFGTANPIPFRVVFQIPDSYPLDVDVALRCSGVYSYRIADPLKFYKNVCGNVAQEYHRSQLDSTLKTEFISALQPALGRLSELELRPNQIMSHTEELEVALNEALSKRWGDRGLKVVSVAFGSVTLPEEDSKKIKDLQFRIVNRDPGVAAATMVDAQAEAMKRAAGNSGGAMNAFMGMNMAANAGGVSTQELFAMQQQKQQQRAAAPAPTPTPAAAPAADSWTCACGTVATGNFCPECGAKRPADGWTCACGTVNKGKFCENCGAKKPAGVPLYRCDKCGWEPEDPAHPPKFCPECGDPFDENDVK